MAESLAEERRRAAELLEDYNVAATLQQALNVVVKGHPSDIFGALVGGCLPCDWDTLLDAGQHSLIPAPVLPCVL